MKLGIGSYTYTWAIGVPGHPPPEPLTAFQLLEKAVSLGVGVVQFCDNLPLTRLSSAELARLERLAKDKHLSIEMGTRGLDQNNLLAHLDLARRFQSPFVRLVIDSAGREPSPEEAIDRLKPVVGSFANARVKLALENHDRFNAATFVHMVEQLGPDRIGICLDTANSFGALEGPEVVVSTLAPYTLNLHIKDFTITRVPSQMGFEIAGCAAGQGRLDVPWLLKQLRSAGRDVNAILELWTPASAALEATLQRENQWAQDSIQYLRNLIPN